MSRPDHDLHQCRADFPALARKAGDSPLAFLDGPAGTQVPHAVINAMTRYYVECNANTHGAFTTSHASDRLIQHAREMVAEFLGAADWRCISFGANMTSLAYALSHAFGRVLGPGDEVVVTQLDHEANRGPWLRLSELGVTVREIALLPSGRLDSEDLVRAIGPKTRLVAIGHASNALGTVNDLVLARRLTRDVAAWLLVDAVHSAPHLPIDVAELDADLLLCSAYKFYGPHVGVLYSRLGLLDTLPTDRLRTQEQVAPYRIETGTLNHAAIVGVAAAIEYLASWGAGATLRQRVVAAMQRIAAHEHRLARQYWEEVQRLPGITVWGPGFEDGPRAPTVSITVEGVPPQSVALRLADAGIQVWDGDFYAVRAMEILGLADRGGVVRVGVSMYNTEEEIGRLLGALARIARHR